MGGSAFDELIGFQHGHFEYLAERFEPVPARDLGKFLRQRGNILGGLIGAFLACWRV
jgi:hypothetical protein